MKFKLNKIHARMNKNFTSKPVEKNNNYSRIMRKLR
jgi:hypothetical protein